VFNEDDGQMFRTHRCCQHNPSCLRKSIIFLMILTIEADTMRRI